MCQQWKKLSHFRPTEQVQRISAEEEGEEDMADANLEADSTGALGTGLVMQHSDTKDRGC